MDLEPGRHYGYGAPPRRPGQALRPVEYVRPGPSRSQRVRIRWLHGEYEDLEECVPKRRLLVLWDEAEAFLVDERRYEAVLDASLVENSTEHDALKMVWLAGVLESQAFSLDSARATAVLLIDDLASLVRALRGPTEAGLLAEPVAFVDRHGTYTAPYPVAIRLAKLACKQFPHDVLAYVTADEKRWQDALTSGYMESAFDHDIVRVRRDKVEETLRELRPVYATVREWCGAEAQNTFDEVAQLRAENERLTRIIEDAARFLKDRGHKVKASLVLRELRRTRPPARAPGGMAERESGARPSPRARRFPTVDRNGLLAGRPEKTPVPADN